MKVQKIVFAFATFALLFSTAPQVASAQWSIGASYEIRDEDPQNGLGGRIEREILQGLPLVNVALRAHFSYFNDDISYENRTYTTEITNYDYGLAAVGGVTVGPISPYVGLGLGASTLDVNRDDLQGVNRPQESSDSSIYWNGFVGSKISIIPAIKPFVEYRFEDVANYKDELNDVQNSNGRMIFGVSLSF